MMASFGALTIDGDEYIRLYIPYKRTSPRRCNSGLTFRRWSVVSAAKCAPVDCSRH
jgi:hypothetical protein